MKQLLKAIGVSLFQIVLVTIFCSIVIIISAAVVGLISYIFLAFSAANINLGMIVLLIIIFVIMTYVNYNFFAINNKEK